MSKKQQGNRKLALLGLVLLALAYVIVDALQPKRGRVFEKYETTNGAFRIRATAYHETALLLIVPGAFYLFETDQAGPGQWREIAMFRHDDPIEIPKDQIRFLNDRVAYLFMGWIYAVTTDGGKSWSVWDASRDLPGVKGSNYRLVQDVQLAADGSGRMSIRYIPERPGEAPSLVTKDYGKHWVPH